MNKLLNYDWLRAVQFKGNTVQKKRKYSTIFVILTVFIINTLFYLCRSDKCFFVVKILTIRSE